LFPLSKRNLGSKRGVSDFMTDHSKKYDFINSYLINRFIVHFRLSTN
jgi:hypothetical protein